MLAYRGGVSVSSSSVDEEIERALREHPATKGVLFNLAVTLVEVGGSIGLFQLGRGLGQSAVVSYLLGSLGPVAGGLAIWVRARKLSGASVAIFAFTALSAVVALVGSTAPKAWLYKDCAATALIGLIFLGSCVLARKPVIFYLAQRYGTDGTHEGMAVFDTMWERYRDFRVALYVIGYWWAALFLVQAAGTAVIIHQTRFSTGYDYDQILPVVAAGLGMAGSAVVGRRATVRGRERRAAAMAEGAGAVVEEA